MTSGPSSPFEEILEIYMISMPVVRPTFKLGVLKMELWAIERVIKFFVFLTNSQGEEAFVVDHIHEWDNHWKVVYASFEEGLNLNEDL